MEPSETFAAAAGGDGIKRMSFRHPFRKYQLMMLDRLNDSTADARHHFVAPPGSGKTIVGIETIHRIGKPAVVFVPTTTIQSQWRDKIAMFLADDQKLDDLVSLDPNRLAPINVFTYQLLATPAQADEQLRAMAFESMKTAIAERQELTPEQAAANLDALEINNPAEFKHELGLHLQRVRKTLAKDNTELSTLLHVNAIELIDRLVTAGIKTIVLDECHHLLSYWALVLRHLINKIEDPQIIGLTATLPSPDGVEEEDNYTELLGDVDFEIPTPAVVKEGDLAPYRDLVYFVEPTERELDYLRNVNDIWKQAVHEIEAMPKFHEWATSLTTTTEDISPLLALAAAEFLAGAEQEVESTIRLIEPFALDVLRNSPTENDQQIFGRLRDAIKPLGFTITGTGMRSTRTPGDLVLSFSAAKDQAVVDILSREHAAMKDSLRAVIVCDFESMTSGVRKAEEILGKDAGSAQRVFRSLVNNEKTNALDPILVTGSVVLFDSDLKSSIVEEFNRYVQSNGLDVQCRIKETAEQGILELTGDGGPWSTRTYVGFVTSLFERGISKCLVGTRGLLGEGWDAISSNTLIDLTSVTTSTSVQQLRGRTIRKDPSWARKVAHNWDVICVAKEFEKGYIELLRFGLRHQKYWGVTALNGTVVKGISHVSQELAVKLATKKFSKIDFDKYTQESLKAIGNRSNSYDLWKVGAEYSNFSYQATSINVTDLKLRTVHSIYNTIRSLARRILLAIPFALWVTLEVFAYYPRNWLFGSTLWIFPITAFGIALYFVLPPIIAMVKTLRNGQPPDAILLDIGRAVLEGLRTAKLISNSLRSDYVRVVEGGDDSLHVFIDYASPEDASTFAKSFEEVLSPVVDQRYLILRTDARLPGFWLQPIWLWLRNIGRKNTDPPTWHPVPSALSKKREHAEAYAAAWTQYVGGGELIYTRKEPGSSVLIAARAQRKLKKRALAFETWE